METQNHDHDSILRLKYKLAVEHYIVGCVATAPEQCSNSDVRLDKPATTVQEKQ